MVKNTEKPEQTDEPEKKKHSDSVEKAGRFAITGTLLAIFNFCFYTFLARVVFQNNDQLWIISAISYIVTTLLAYVVHSKITWKGRTITKHNTIMFFVWNGITAILISPFFTWLFSLFTPLYEFAHGISSFLHLPFDYNFVESTGVFCLTTAVTMTLNFFFYDRIVFSKKKSK